MADKKISIAAITSKLFDILEPLETDDRSKTIAAVQTLLGNTPITQTPPANAPAGSGGSGAATNILRTGGAITEKAFFDQKDPRNKGEELLVAARYRELYQGAFESNKENFEQIIGVARRNFDSNNFKRDLDNAKTKGLFNKGPRHTVSYYGQQYVDAMPDREAVKGLRRPKKAGKKATKKKT